MRDRRYVGVFAFKQNEWLVALVQKQKGPRFLHGKWNGIGGKMEPDEMSARGSAIREFKEETGIEIALDDLVPVETQRFEIERPGYHEIHWYAARLPDDATLPTFNDAGEPLLWGHMDQLDESRLCPNLGYLLPKARILLQTPYLERPGP